MTCAVYPNADFCMRRLEYRLGFGIVVFIKHLLSQNFIDIVLHHLLIGFNKNLMANELRQD